MSAEPGYIKGPWRLDFRPEVAFIVGPNRESIAERAHGNFGVDEKTKATMQLVAAAPDMLEALEMALHHLDDRLGTSYTYHAICAAIAKAKGNVEASK